MKTIHEELFHLRKHITCTISHMDAMELLCVNLDDYKNFVINMNQHKEVLNEINKNLKMISPFGMTFSKINQTGHIMKTFYTIYQMKNQMHWNILSIFWLP